MQFIGEVYRIKEKFRIQSPDGQDYFFRIRDSNCNDPELLKYIGRRVLCEGTILNSMDIGLNFYAVFIDLV